MPKISNVLFFGVAVNATKVIPFSSARAAICDATRSTAVGIMSQLTSLITRLMPSRSSLDTSANRRASLAMRNAYDCSPTAVARASALPDTTKLPESTLSSLDFSTGSDAPVSSDSSTMSPVVSSTRASTAI